LSFTEEDIKRAAETKLWIEERLNELKEEESRLRELLLVVDGVLKASSFMKASEISPAAATPAPPPLQPEQEVRPLRTRDGRPLAQAVITPKSVSINLAEDVYLKASTPPFKTFYLNRILAGMRRRDEEMMRSGSLRPDEMLNFVVEEEGDRLKRIIINNYRDQDRLSEILKSAVWVFSRMLEKAQA
jgi:hypothetical protein